jgi:hypothetical protein
MISPKITYLQTAPNQSTYSMSQKCPKTRKNPVSLTAQRNPWLKALMMTKIPLPTVVRAN